MSPIEERRVVSCVSEVRGEKPKSKRVDFTRLGREKEISPMPTGEREELSPTGKWEMSPLEREKGDVAGDNWVAGSRQ